MRELVYPGEQQTPQSAPGTRPPPGTLPGQLRVPQGQRSCLKLCARVSVLTRTPIRVCYRELKPCIGEGALLSASLHRRGCGTREPPGVCGAHHGIAWEHRHKAENRSTNISWHLLETTGW